MLYIPLWRRILILAVVLAGVLLALPNLFYSRVETANDARATIETGVTNPELEAQAALWPSFLPSNLVNLGLDLRGGAHLLAEVQVEQVYASRMEALWPALRDALAAERDTVGFVTREESEPGILRVRISDADGAQRAVEIARGLAQPVSGLTGGSASSLDVRANGPVLSIQLSEAERAATDERTLLQSLEIVRRRIDEAGTREPTIQRQGEDRILIDVPGVGSADEVKALIGTTAQLNFQPVVTTTSDANADVGTTEQLAPDASQEGLYYVLERSPVVTGDELVDAQPTFDQNGQPAVSFRFNTTGARAFGDYTAENVGAPFAIVLDNEVISAPVIRERIPGGTGQISGNFSVEESTNLAVLLRAGALPAELTFLEERTIGPELGADSIRAGQLAAVVGSLLVVVFMALTYGLFGWFANVALAVNMVMIFGVLSLIGATLTLPGIAGIVLTMGMAVDANVLVYERIREELKTAKGPARAIDLGYSRALSAILDSNVTTLITAVILYAVGSGPVRGFAITLGLGILTSVFSAIFVTRLLVVIWFDRRRPKTIEV
ncbi:protein translocase subunit SecD [Pseudoroseicyclus aestuarii]|uniref:Protein translocase subunit SecD n=1 Tax=Pseudoroseicyclus aestuarii TaxID=1795041 RepID=A0A318TAV7_9RHOB|nr:protein translocase subunit SecD [Pseudoroseicyclus aestuarii]PYE85448.1 preprotein translocase subunit SecD [Pseudoroseicyclus aestuarii]